MSDLEKRIARLSSTEVARLREELGKIRNLVNPNALPQVDSQIDASPLPSFSLFFFSADSACERETDLYRNLMEWSRYADENGFEAIWTPERHFNRFGGSYPSPAVLAGALAARTTRIALRAGSVVAPLWHPVRIAEEWAVVDNLSGGRAGLSFAPGWHPADFVIDSQAYVRRRELTLERIEIVRKLWAGDTITFHGGGIDEVPVRLFPRPVQANLPIWITSTGTEETWRRAAEYGVNVLTGLVNQSVETLYANIRMYRSLFQPTPANPRGRVTLMLHTFVGDEPDRTRELARGPLLEYLRNHLGLYEGMLRTEIPGLDVADFTESDREALLHRGVERYLSSSSLVGSREEVYSKARSFRAEGVDEIACLIDFGLPPAEVERSIECIRALSVPAAARRDG